MAGRFANLEFDEGQEGEGRRTQVPSQQEPDAQQYLDRAFEARCWNDHELALRMYTRCLHEDRKVITAWVGQVQMLVELGEYAEARTWSDKALEVFRNNGELASAKAQACARIGDLSSAIACSDAAMAAPGSSPWRWEARGEVLLARKVRHHDKCFQQALVDPQGEPYDRVTICRIYRHYGRPANALAYLQPAIERCPQNGYLWLERGLCEAGLGLKGAAQSSFKRCLDARPTCKAAADALASVTHASFWLRMRGLTRRMRRR